MGAIRLRRVVLIFAACLSSTLLSGVTARAQTPAPNAIELADKARLARDAGRLDEAIDSYARAYQESGDVNFLFSLAECHRQAAHPADAVRMFQNYLRKDPHGVHAESADKQLKEVERQMRKDELKAAAAGRSSPAAAPVRLPPAPSPAPAAVTPPPPAAVRPAAPVAPPTPMSTTPPPPSAVAIVVSAPPPAATQPMQAQPAGVDLTAQAPAPAPTDATEPPMPRWVPWALGGTTVVLGVAAIASGVSASNHYDQLKTSCGQTTGGCTDAQIDDVKSRAQRANILWALTGVAAVGTGVTFYVNTHAAGFSGVWRF
jgi:hypothetical protein